jgi:hypothetical protein
VQRLTQPQIRAASQTLLTAVVSGRLTHPTDPDTDLELGNAGQAPTGDGLLRLSRKNSTGRSTAAFSVAAAAHAVLGPRVARPAIFVADS